MAFIYAELTKVVRQNDKVRVGNIDDDAEKLLKARFIHESDENYPKGVCMCTQRMNLL